MKKFLICLLAAWMAVGSAIAEETPLFPFRNGIEWGMSPEQVQAAENTDSEVNESGEVREVQLEGVPLAGADFTLVYSFAEDGLFLVSWSGAADAAVYDALLEALTAQHGTPDENEVLAASLMNGYSNMAGDGADFDEIREAMDSAQFWKLEDGTLATLFMLDEEELCIMIARKDSILPSELLP